MKRITFGLVSLMTAVLLIAHAIGLVPDRDGALLQKRVTICEALAVETALAVQRKDVPAVWVVTETLAKRNPEIVSVGVRDAAGNLEASAGDHAGWEDPPDGRSTATHMVIPITQADRTWGRVEVQFQPIAGSGFWALVGGGHVPAVRLHVGRRVRRRVFLPAGRPPARRPGREPGRAGAGATDARNHGRGRGSAGQEQRIALANTKFAQTVGRSPDELRGKRVTDLPWVAAKADAPTAEFPWAKALRDAVPQIGTILGLADGGRKRTVSVNATPIFDDGAVLGALTTVDDLTPVQRRERRSCGCCSAG